MQRQGQGLGLEHHDLGRVEQEIISYLRKNPGSSKADITRHLGNLQLSSRMTVLQYIKALETSNIIYGKKLRLNRQSFMMYVNEENKYLSITTELNNFMMAYTNLLKKSIEVKASNKRYSIYWKEQMTFEGLKKDVSKSL